MVFEEIDRLLADLQKKNLDASTEEDMAQGIKCFRLPCIILLNFWTTRTFCSKFKIVFCLRNFQGIATSSSGKVVYVRMP